MVCVVDGRSGDAALTGVRRRTAVGGDGGQRGEGEKEG